MRRFMVRVHVGELKAQTLHGLGLFCYPLVLSRYTFSVARQKFLPREREPVARVREGAVLPGE